MKKLTGFSLFVFFCFVSAILTAGLVFYQNKNSNNTSSTNTIQNDISKLAATGVNILDMAEISKHNKSSDCWLLVEGKVYDITSYFGSHPGGSGTMSATCGKDATSAYKTKDPYASSASGNTSHSSNARGLLTNYYIGDLNQKIDQNTINQNIQKAKATVVPAGKGGDEDDDDD